MYQLDTSQVFGQPPQAIAILNIRVKNLADRLNLLVDEWTEEIGIQIGFSVRLASGVCLMVREDQNLIRDGEYFGPVIEVLSNENADSVSDILTEMLDEFGLSDEFIQSQRLSMNEWT